ncbi:retrovirus-related pol polyprotein from transposon TNT 1-94 [Tanacetum coccineum]|uniref:Retrovirus-related pol polyprotein from transposon TNT 1-94 n=1 Tax=Tanacetum coccineum TaxID=301880 RepID=A0ABQ5B740_9ASTR
MDTGASSHLADNTGILTSFSNSSIYPSVFVDNGNSVLVTHTEHSFLHTSYKPLHLNHILVTPYIIKNLIYVCKFTHDNDVYVEFDAYGFSVKDYQTQKILLRCDSTGDLYPVTQQPPLQTPIVLLSFSSTTWHRRLGHPGDDIIFRTLFGDPMHKKSDLFDNFVAFRAYVNKQFNVDIKALQCDNGSEYDNIRFHDLFRQNGIQFRFSCSRTSQQNGKSERMLRTINNLIRTLLFQAHIPPSYWMEALNMVAHLLNILPSTAINYEIPFTKLYNQTPTYEQLRVFGCLCYPHVNVSHKLEPCSTPCIFLGYLANHRGYKCLDLASNKIIISRHVRFDEDVFPFENVTSSNKPTYDFLLPPIQTTTNVPTTEPFFQHMNEPNNPITPHPTTPPITPPQPDTPPSHTSTPIPTSDQTQSHAQTVDSHTPIPINNSSQTMSTHPMRFTTYATRVGFQHSKTNSSLFVFHRGSDIAYLLLYMDDIILTASSSAFPQRIIASLHSEFAMKDLGSLNYFLGISAQRSTSGLTHVDTESKLGSDGDPVSYPTLGMSMGTKKWYGTGTVPVCLYMHDPREPHFTTLKRILRYIRGIVAFGLQLHASSTAQLTAYTNADWARCLITRRSTSGYYVTLSRSSVEAEYHGVVNVVVETAWLRNLLLELHAPLTTTTLVYCDNVSVVYLSTNPIQHQRTKHIEIDIHLVRDYVASGQLRCGRKEGQPRSAHGELEQGCLVAPLLARNTKTEGARSAKISQVASLPADQDSTNTTKNVPHRKLWLSMAAVVSRIGLSVAGKENGVNILKSIDERPFQMGIFQKTLAEGNEGALHLGPEQARVYYDLSPEDKERYNADIRATNILLQGLPKDIYTLINHYTDAKDIWDNMKMPLKGSKLTKEDRESQLYDDFEHFRQNKGETIHNYYVRFTKLINDMRNIKMTMPRMQLNSKFVNNMLPEWGRFVTAVKLNRGLKESNYDQLYSYLKQHEAHANENKMITSSNTRNQATVQDGRVVVQNIQGRQYRGQGNNPRGVGAAINGGAQNSVGNANPGQARQIKCYNCNGGHDTAVDEDVDESPAPTAQTMFMANLSLTDPVYDVASPSYDSDILSEVHEYDNYQDVVCEYHAVHEMHHDDNAKPVVQSNVSSMPNDAYMMIINEMHEQTAQSISANKQNKVVNASLTAELATYKEQVELYERRAKFELTEREQKIEEQLRIVITDRNIKEENLKKGTLLLERELSGDLYTQTQLTPRQIFWSKDVLKIKAEALKEQTPTSRLIKALTVYPPNTPATLVLRVLPTKSQVKSNIFALIQLFLEFEKTSKKRITPAGLTEGERGFEQTKECYLSEIILFFKTLKEHFEGIQKALTKEIKEIKEFFKESEAEVDQNVVNRKYDEIEQKNLLIANDNLIADCLSKEVFYIATNYELIVSRFTEMHDDHTVVHITQLTKKVTVLQEQNELFGAENAKIKQHYKELYDSIKITHAKHIKPTATLLTENENLKAQIHENPKCITMDSVKLRVLAPSRYAIDVELIPPRSRNNREVHLDYLKHLKKSIETLREIVEEDKVEIPLDRSLASGYLYTKHSQELLEYVIGTCPKDFNKRDKKHASTPLTRKKQVTFEDQCEMSNNNTHKHVKQLNIQKTNVLMIPSTGVNSCTDASGSQPRSNTKKNRISPAKSVNKKKVKEHPRTNKSSLKNTNRVDSNIISKRTQTENVSTSKIVITEKLSNTSQKPLNSYQRRNKQYKAIPTSISTLTVNKAIDTSIQTDVVHIVLWYLDSGCSKHMMGDHSRLRNFIKKFIGTVRFENDHFGAIMGYGDYVIGDSVISRVYYVEGLGHNLFSVRQFYDSDLEVAFRKHSCYVRDIQMVLN